jgi:hypothetical protein
MHTHARGYTRAYAYTCSSEGQRPSHKLALCQIIKFYPPCITSHWGFIIPQIHYVPVCYKKRFYVCLLSYMSCCREENSAWWSHRKGSVMPVIETSQEYHACLFNCNTSLSVMTSASLMSIDHINRCEIWVLECWNWNKNKVLGVSRSLCVKRIFGGPLKPQFQKISEHF